MDPLMYLYFMMGSILFMVELLVGECFFMKSVFRRPFFARRFRIACAVALPVVALINLGYWYFALTFGFGTLVGGIVVIVTYLLMFALSLAMLAYCYNAPFSVLLMSGAAGYASQHLVSNVISVIRVFTNADVLAFSGPLPALIFNLAQVVVFAVVGIPIYFLFVRPANRIDAPVLVTKRVVGLSLTTLLITLAFNCARDLFASESTGLYVISCLFSVMCCLFVLIVRSDILEQSGLRRERDMINRLSYDEKRQYEMSKENIELINIKCHDIRHQLDSLAMRSGPAFARELSELRDAVSIYDAMLHTGNETLDTVLIERSLYCEKHGIRLTCNADGSALWFMSESEICSFFGNALSNAVEAVSALDDPEKRVISLVVRRAAGQVSVLTENYCDGPVRFERGMPVTTKPDARYHGFGVKSMMRIAEKYGGTLSLSAQGNVFRMCAIFQPPE